MLDLDEIKRVWAAATPQEWTWKMTCDTAASADIGPAELRAIASAPTHVAALIAEVERLRARLVVWEREPQGPRTAHQTWEARRIDADYMASTAGWDPSKHSAIENAAHDWIGSPEQQAIDDIGGVEPRERDE